MLGAGKSKGPYPKAKGNKHNVPLGLTGQDRTTAEIFKND